MPEIKLTFGKMDLDTDPTGKTEQVSATLYNAFRVGGSFHRAPGLTEFADIGENYPVYAFYSSLHNVCLAVCGMNEATGYANLYSISSAGAVALIEFSSLTVNTPAVFAEDATRILIVANSGIHIYTVTTGTITEVLSGQAPAGVTHISIVRGFLIANGLDSGGGGLAGDFGWSNDASYATWAYENNAANSDVLQALITTTNDDIFFIGKTTIEVNTLSSDATNPFYVNKPASQPYGTPAPYTVAHDGQNVYMLVTVGGNRQLLRLMDGRTPQLFGFTVGTAIDDIADITAMQGFIIGHRGRTFYVLTHPTAEVTIEDQVHVGLTLAFDTRSEEWHIWGDWDSQAGEYNDYRGRSFTYAEAWDNKRLIGGDDGKIYLMDTSKTFGGDVVRMALMMGHRSHGTIKRKTCLEYAYDFRAGVGTETVVNPVFQHRWRDDGSLAWKTPRTIAMGSTGNRAIPQKSRQCGMYRKRQDELIFTDAVEVVFNGIYEEVEVEK